MSIAEGSVAVAATLMYSAPVFVYLVSFACKLERPSPLKWAACAVVIVGIVLLTQIYNTDSSNVTPIAVGTGLLAGLSKHSSYLASSARRRMVHRRRFS